MRSFALLKTYLSFFFILTLFKIKSFHSRLPHFIFKPSIASHPGFPRWGLDFHAFLLQILEDTLSFKHLAFALVLNDDSLIAVFF